MTVQVQEISVAHSPDSDDAFMFYAIAQKKVDTRGLKIHQVHKDIQSLNKEALEGKYEVTAISFATYPYVKDRYMLMPCGASMGDKYGPVVVSKKPLSKDDLTSARLAIPGKLTTAYLALRLYHPELTNVTEVHFQDIPAQVAAGNFDAGLLIHEGQLTYMNDGLSKIVDLGEWWHDETGLPLPLGGNVIRKDLGPKLIKEVTDMLKEGIQFALDNRQDALDYALTFARDMPTDLADKFVSMYVNGLTVDQGARGRAAVHKLFELANEKGLYDEEIVPEFVY